MPIILFSIYDHVVQVHRRKGVVWAQEKGSKVGLDEPMSATVATCKPNTFAKPNSKYLFKYHTIELFC